MTQFGGGAANLAERCVFVAMATESWRSSGALPSEWRLAAVTADFGRCKCS
jgi:hypothetical protein